MSSSNALFVDKIHVKIDQESILKDVSISLPEGKITALLGPNGSGKSTLLRSLAGLQLLKQGQILLKNKKITDYTTRELAKTLAFLPQTTQTPSNLCVRDLVACGRYPYHGLLGRLRADDHASIDWALEVTDLLSLQNRPVETLSGGQCQRAWIALCLAQKTKILLLDEPTTFLDIRHQHEILQLIHRIQQEQKLTIVWVLHDLNQAMQYSDEVILLKQGEVVIQGEPAKALTPPLLQQTFGVNMSLVYHAQAQQPCLMVVSGKSQNQ